MALICKGGDKFVERGSFVKKGSTLIESQPFVACLSSKFRTERCDACFKSGQISRCSGCQYVYYCSRNCQKQSWTMHKVECPNLKRVQKGPTGKLLRVVPDAVRMMSRIIIKLQNEKEARGYYSSEDSRTFNDLMCHYCNLKDDMKKMEHFTAVFAVLMELLPQEMLPNVRELIEIFGRMTINSFSILDNQQASIGVGLYLGPSIIDHSCKPNAVAIFDGTRLMVRSLEDIPFFDWTKVSITYVDVLRCVDERREELQNNYYFWCDCERCNNPKIIETAAACPNKNCTNPCFPEDSTCGKCGQEFPEDFRDDFEMICSNSLRHLEKLEKNPNLITCRMCLKQQEGLLHPLNILHVRVLEKAFITAMELELWEEAEIYAPKLTERYEYYYGDAHPVTAHMYVNLGIVLSYGKKFKEAHEVIKHAVKIVKLAFGENHPEMDHVMEVACSIFGEYKKIKDD